MLNNTFTNIVSAYIKEHHLLDRKSTHLVALSGGADSVSLLRVLLSLNYNVVAAHCNFHLRDQESERDELFCRELCKALDVNLHVTHFDTKAYSQKHHVSIEMAAREQRYQWFQQLIEQHHYASICVAHHADDAIETMFINIQAYTVSQAYALATDTLCVHCYVYRMMIYCPTCLLYDRSTLLTAVIKYQMCGAIKYAFTLCPY